ncbi:uncharacterized protein [Physcomitrium patens]|uniref:uncharacterized protein isoform X2 n=1 Tax=Physcomitrium patens TaxID=3218 RepID=UPI003CCDA7DA
MANNAFTKYCGICGGHNKNYGGISNIPYQMISSAREGKRATLSASSLPWSEARRAMRRPISRHADWVRLVKIYSTTAIQILHKCSAAEYHSNGWNA